MGGRGQERWGGKDSGLMKQVCLGFTNTHSMPTPSGGHTPHTNCNRG
jgi:hypothetical protein